jgi:DNA-binding SARP family transcriptional activator
VTPRIAFIRTRSIPHKLYWFFRICRDERPSPEIPKETLYFHERMYSEGVCVYNQDNSLLLFRTLLRLSPDVFSHPIWIHFDEERIPPSPSLIYTLLQPAQELLTNGDIQSACEILLLCAVLQKRTGDLKAALNSTQQAWTLAEFYGLTKAAEWAAWGSSALCAHQGKFLEAAGHLEWLQNKLKSEKDWILGNIVELFVRALYNRANQKEPTGIDLNWLVRWGESPLAVGSFFQQAYRHTEGSRAPPKTRPPDTNRTWWQRSWQKLLGIATGKLKIEIVEQNEPASSREAVSELHQHQSGVYTPPAPALNLLNRHNDLSRSPSSPQDLPAVAGSLPFQPDQSQPGPQLVVYSLGQFRVYLNEKTIENWSSKKGLSIFKYLTIQRQTPLPKEVLMEIFWPEADPEAARRNLHQAIYSLRQTLNVENVDFQHVLFENDRYFLNPALKLWLDVEEFERRVQSGHHYEERHSSEKAMSEYAIAEGLYQGDFLSEDLYEEWTQNLRQHYWQSYLDINQRLAQYYLARSEYAACIALSLRILSIDSSQEEAHRILMKCYMAQGQRHLAIRQYQLCVQTLKSELNLPPSGETQALYEQIIQA